MNVRTPYALAPMLVVAALAALAAQETARNVWPTVIADIGAPGIDRGLHDSDAARAPRTSDDARLDRERPFMRGSLIVKFRAGVAATAQRAMLDRVRGVVTQALPYSDFDIVAIDATTDPEV